MIKLILFGILISNFEYEIYEEFGIKWDYVKFFRIENVFLISNRLLKVVKKILGLNKI